MDCIFTFGAILLEFMSLKNRTYRCKGDLVKRQYVHVHTLYWCVRVKLVRETSVLLLRLWEHDQCSHQQQRMKG